MSHLVRRVLARRPLARRLLPPLAPAFLAGFLLLQVPGVVAQQVEPDPSAGLEISCERLTIQFMMAGWAIQGTCEYRLCRGVDEDGLTWTLGGVPVTWIEVDCGPLGTHTLNDDTPGAS